MGKLVGPRTGVRHVLADVSRHFVSRTGHRGPQEGYGDTDSDASLYAAVNTDIDTDTDLDAEISTDIDSTTDADSPGPRRPNTRWGRGRGVEGKGVWKGKGCGREREGVGGGGGSLGWLDRSHGRPSVPGTKFMVDVFRPRKRAMFMLTPYVFHTCLQASWWLLLLLVPAGTMIGISFVAWWAYSTGYCGYRVPFVVRQGSHF